mgnify:CR=1 FL=1
MNADRYGGTPRPSRPGSRRLRAALAATDIKANPELHPLINDRLIIERPVALRLHVSLVKNLCSACTRSDTRVRFLAWSNPQLSRLTFGREKITPQRFARVERQSRCRTSFQAFGGYTPVFIIYSALIGTIWLGSDLATSRRNDLKRLPLLPHSFVNRACG